MSLREVQVSVLHADETLARLAVLALRQRVSIRSVDVDEDRATGTDRIGLLVAVEDDAAGARFLAGIEGLVDVARVRTPSRGATTTATR